MTADDSDSQSRLRAGWTVLVRGTATGISAGIEVFYVAALFVTALLVYALLTVVYAAATEGLNVLTLGAELVGIDVSGFGIIGALLGLGLVAAHGLLTAGIDFAASNPVLAFAGLLFLISLLGLLWAALEIVVIAVSLWVAMSFHLTGVTVDISSFATATYVPSGYPFGPFLYYLVPLVVLFGAGYWLTATQVSPSSPLTAAAAGATLAVGYALVLAFGYALGVVAIDMAGEIIKKNVEDPGVFGLIAAIDPSMASPLGPWLATTGAGYPLVFGTLGGLVGYAVPGAVDESAREGLFTFSAVPYRLLASLVREGSPSSSVS